MRSYPHYPPCDIRLAFFQAIREEAPASDDELLGRLSDARCFVECAINSLIVRDEGGFFSSELVCLRHGIESLRGVYNELDLRLPRPG